MPTQDEQDYKDYQEYLEYQSHVAKTSADSMAKSETDGAKFGTAGEKFSPVQTALETGLDSALAKYTPQIAGVGSLATGNEYLKGRDAQSARLASMAAQNPGAATFGNVAGGVASALGAGKLLKMLGLAGKLGQSATVAGNVAEGAAIGAGQGAIINPGDKPGVIDPAQLSERAENGAIGAALGGTLGGAAKIASKGAGLADNVRLVKDAPRLLSETQNRLGQALDTLQGKVSANEIPLQKALTGKSIQITPDELNSLSGSVRKSLLGASDSPSLPINGTQPGVTMDAVEAMERRRAADELANWHRTKGADAEAFAGKDEQANLANMLRAKLNAAAPEVGPIQANSAEAYKHMDTLKALKARPIEGVQTKAATTRRALLENADKAAGSDLTTFGDNITAAKANLLDPNTIINPLQLPNNIRKGAVRLGAEAGRAINKSPVSREQLNQAVINATIGNKRGQSKR